MHCDAHAQLMFGPHQLNPVVRSVQYVSIGSIGVLVIMYNSNIIVFHCVYYMNMVNALEHYKFSPSS